MRFKFLILIFLMFGRLIAQTSYFISPIIDTKTFTSSTYGQLFNNGFMLSDKVATNPYFNLNNKVVSTRSNIQLGLTIGCSLKNDKHFLALGWNQDATGSQVETQIMSYSTNKFPEDDPNLKRYYDNGSRFSSLLFLQRLSIQYSTRISKNTEAPMQIYFTTSLGFFYNKLGSKKNGTSTVTSAEYIISSGNTGATYLDTNIFISGERHIVTPINRFSTNISVGISIDFKTRKKSKYLFSTSLSILHGFRVLESTAHMYTISDAGQLKSYSYETVSKGSGLYLQVFRRFNLYPKKIKLKK